MMADYPAVMQLLKDIEDPSKAKLVGQEIEGRSEDPRFITLLQIAIRDQQLPFNTQLAGAVVLSRVLSEMYFKCDQEILADTLINLIADMQVEYRIKQTLQLNLTSVLEISSQELFNKLVFKAAQLIIMGRKQESIQIQSQNTDIHTNKIKSGTLILRCLLNSKAHFSLLAKVIAEQFFQSTLTAIKGFSVKEINTLIGLAQFWKEVLQKSRNGSTKDHSQLLRLLARSQLLSEWIFYLYRIDHLPGQECYINPQSSLDHQQISKLKVAAADLHKQILIGLELTQSINQQITNRHLSQVNTIINTMCIFASYQKVCTAYEDFTVELLGITILTVKLFRSSYDHNYDRLLHIVVFPFLVVTSEERQLFADDPTQFNNLAQDCCDKQSYGILKTEAAKLLETVCDDINMAATYTIQHAIISLKVRLNLDPNIAESSQNFLTIQQAFTVLTILSYRLGRHQLQLKELRSILIVQNIMKKVNPLQLTRILQFLAYNYQEIYPYYGLGESWMKMALNVSIEQAQNYPSLAYSALDFISNVLQNCFVESIVIQYLQQNYNFKSFDVRFKILLKIMGKYFINFTLQGLALALQKLLQAVLNDLQSYHQNKKAHTMDISHSLHICRRIADRPDLISNGSPVRAKIWEFISHLQRFRKIHLDDQIVKIVTAIIRCEGLGPQVHQILPKFLSILCLDYSQTAYIIFINEVALRVNDPLGFGLFYPLLEGLKHLHSNILQRPTSASDNLALGTILLVLQNIISVFGEKLDAQRVEEVAQSAMLILPISDEPEDKTEAIIIARALNLLFICHMHKRDKGALKKMLQFSDALLFRGHDLRVLTICLTKQIFRQTDIIAVTQMIIYLVNSIWKARQQPPQIKSKRNPKVQIKSTVIKIHKVANYQVCLKGMLQPFSDQIIPELQLRQTLTTMKVNNNYLYQSIINTVPNKVSERLRQLISVVTIEGRKRKILKTGENKNIVYSNVNNLAPKKRDFDSSDEQAEQMNEDDQGPSTRKGMIKKKRKEEELSYSNL